MKELLPYLGEKTARDRIDEIFSREVLGSVLVGSSFFKVIENSLKYYTVGGMDFIGLASGYSALFIISVILFAYWDKLIKISEDAQEKAKETAEQTQQKVEEATKEKVNSRKFIFDLFSKKVECEIRWKDKKQ